MLKAIVIIMEKHNFFREEIISAFNQPFPDGRKLFDMLMDENTLIELFAIIGTDKIDLDYVDKKEDNVLHRLAEKDYINAVRKLYDGMKDFAFRKLMFQKNLKGNNPLMSAAINNSNQTLCFLMYKLAAHLSDNEKDDLLHHRNTFGETLLSYVLQQQGTLPVPQTILLELEKGYHGSEKDVTRCFRETLQSSLEVHDALANME